MASSIGQNQRNWMHNGQKSTPLRPIAVKSRPSSPGSVWPRWLGRWFASAPETAAPPPPSSADHLKEQRLRRAGRREHLYAVVRENMIRAGVLSSAYKFKVLTLDHDGLNHLVLIDIQPQAMAALSEGEHGVEAYLKTLARERLGVEVKAVYWRVLPTADAAHPMPPRAPAPNEAVGDDELHALHQALDASPRARQAGTHPDFEPTRPMSRTPDRGFSPLSDTQMGDLE